MLCSALLLLAISLMMFSDKIFDENIAPVGTMVSLGIVILVGILAVRNKYKILEKWYLESFCYLRISSTISFEMGIPKR